MRGRAFPEQYNQLGLNPGRYDMKESLAAGMIALDKNHSTWHEVFLPWWRCSMKLECIAPVGSNQSNHRWDQSALSIIFHAIDEDREARSMERLFLERSPIYWLSNSMLSTKDSIALQNPYTAIRGLVFFVRRRHFPKPFATFIQKKISIKI
mmetsp:Transcript_5960/g.20998  ORF Transcript_5960/g.20998 Transcript_5960/m.20998 type:complete len:152 (+) Transcript_5960:95-550(+)